MIKSKFPHKPKEIHLYYHFLTYSCLSMNFSTIQTMIQDGKFEDAMLEIDALAKDKEIEALILHSRIFEQTNQYEKSLQEIERAITLLESQSNGIDKTTKMAITQIVKARGFYRLYKFEELLDIFNNIDEMLEQIRSSNQELEPSWLSLYHEVRGFHFHMTGQLLEAAEEYNITLTLAKKAGSNSKIIDALIGNAEIMDDLGDLENSFDLFSQALDTSRKIEKEEMIGFCLLKIGSIYSKRGMFEIAILNIEKSMALYRKINNSKGITECLNLIGSIQLQKGEIDQALILFEEAYAIAENNSYYSHVANSAYNIGMSYQAKRQYQKSITNLQESNQIWEDIGNDLEKSKSLYHLSIVLTELGEFDEVNKLIVKLEKINQNAGNQLIDLRVKMANAALLKKQNRLREMVKAQKIYESVVYDDSIDNYEMKVIAMLDLCELLLFELHSTNDEIILEDANKLLNRILTISGRQNSDALMIEVLILKSKFASLGYQIKIAVDYLDQARAIASEKGLNASVFKINQHQNKLLSDIEKWKKVSEDQTPLRERIDQMRISEYLQEVTNLFRSKETE